jgi:NAD+ synthetase
MTYVELPISAMHDAYERQLDGVFGKLAETTKPAQHDLAEQNIQARIRGAALMAVSNKFDHLLLTTGNKSEIATGYCTLYGDMCGGLAVISDVPKTTVWALARWINTLPAAVRRSKLPVIEQAKQEALIPVSSIEKPPSAELKPGQVDQDSLPPYEVLDAILEMYIEEEASLAEMVGAGHDEALVRRVIRMVERSEYKRRQAAPGLKVTSRAFGFGRRMPIAQRYEPYVKPGQR